MLEPMLASAADVLPVGPDWSYEPKWDGYRAIAEKGQGRAADRSAHERQAHDLDQIRDWLNVRCSDHRLAGRSDPSFRPRERH
jgi:hypothetical protein